MATCTKLITKYVTVGSALMHVQVTGTGQIGRQSAIAWGT